jgi:hypothetical protein
MRTVAFPVSDRVVLIPMELFPALRKYLWIVPGILVIMGLSPQGILFRPAIVNSWPVIIAGLLGIIAGTVVTPALLPWIPFRSFAAKGAVAGMAMLAPVLCSARELFMGDPFLGCAVGLFFTAVASYLALNFTGCTTFTNISGVKKEMRYAVPVYITSCAIAAILLVIFKLREWGIII